MIPLIRRADVETRPIPAHIDISLGTQTLEETTPRDGSLVPRPAVKSLLASPAIAVDWVYTYRHSIKVTGRGIKVLKGYGHVLGAFRGRKTDQRENS